MAKKKTKLISKRATQGEKMIEVRISFWTNKIAAKKDEIVPKHAWVAGVVRMGRNDSHGIKPGNPLVFHTLLDVGSVIEKVLVNHGIILHPNQKMRKYLSGD